VLTIFCVKCYSSIISRQKIATQIQPGNEALGVISLQQFSVYFSRIIYRAIGSRVACAYATQLQRPLGQAQCPTFIGASPTTRKNARSPRQRPRPAAHRFQRSQTILRHVGCPAVDAKFTTAARRRRLFHNNVANRRHRSAVVHRRLIFIDCWPSALLAADDRAVSQPAHGTVVKVMCRPLAP